MPAPTQDWKVVARGQYGKFRSKRRPVQSPRRCFALARDSTSVGRPHETPRVARLNHASFAHGDERNHAARRVLGMQQHNDPPNRNVPADAAASPAGVSREDGRRNVATGGAFEAKRRSLALRALGVFVLFAALYFARGALQPLAIAGILALVL